MESDGGFLVGLVGLICLGGPVALWLVYWFIKVLFIDPPPRLPSGVSPSMSEVTLVASGGHLYTADQYYGDFTGVRNNVRLHDGKPFHGRYLGEDYWRGQTKAMRDAEKGR